MKTFFTILAIVSCIFICNVEGAQKRKRSSATKQVVAQGQIATNKVSAQAAQNERQILTNNCYTLRSNIRIKFSGMGMGSARGSGCQNAIREAITSYLNSVGTQTARQLLNELQANGFKEYIN